MEKTMPFGEIQMNVIHIIPRCFLSFFHFLNDRLDLRNRLLVLMYVLGLIIGKLYLDGKLAVETEGSGGALRYMDDEWTQFGAGRGNKNRDPRQFFNGVIDEIRIYNRALTPEEIAKMWSAPFAVASRGKLTTTWGRIKEQ